MNCMRIVGLALLVVIVDGCKTGKAPVAEPASPETVQRIRQSYQQLDPNARVGLVIAVLEPERLAAVGDMPVQDFADGDVLVLIDSAENVIGVGTVVARTADALHVRYEPRGDAGRAPQVGDLAVRSSR